MWHFRGMSDDMAGKNRNGTWEALAGPERPDTPLGDQEKSPLIRKRKGGKLAGWRMES